jgi:hypothetical protein
MSKASVTRLFVGAVLAVVVGVVIALGAILAALAGGAVTIGGSTPVTIDGAAFGGTLVWLAIAAFLIAAGAAAAVASWIGALFNTAKLEDKTWFVALLLLGVFSLGWVAMGAYVLAGPDSTTSGKIATGFAPASPS